MGSRHDGTNPRSLGTNPRAQTAAHPAASPGGGISEAGQEVSPQIISDILRFYGAPPENIPVRSSDGADVLITKGQFDAWVKLGKPSLSEKEWRSTFPVLLPTDPTPPLPLPRPDTRGPEWKVGEEKNPDEGRFMSSVREVLATGSHDDDCASRKSKECGCSDNIHALAEGRLKELESRHTTWNVVQQLSRHDEPVITKRAAKLVRVDEGRNVLKVIPDPLSQTAKPITITVHEPPRWVCTSCAASMRGTDIDHHCDESMLSRVGRPAGLERRLPPEVRFGGDYRLIVWRDRAGEYHLGEQVISGDKVLEEQHLYGPDSFNIIEGALLDAAVTKLAP